MRKRIARPGSIRQVLTGAAAEIAADRYRRVDPARDIAVAQVGDRSVPLLIVPTLPEGEHVITLGFSLHESPEQAPFFCLRFTADYLPEPLALAFGPRELRWVVDLADQGCFGVTADPGEQGAAIQPFWYHLGEAQVQGVLLYLQRVNAWTLDQTVLGLLMKADPDPEPAGAPPGAVLQ